MTTEFVINCQVGNKTSTVHLHQQEARDNFKDYDGIVALFRKTSQSPSADQLEYEGSEWLPLQNNKACIKVVVALLKKQRTVTLRDAKSVVSTGGWSSGAADTSDWNGPSPVAEVKEDASGWGVPAASSSSGGGWGEPSRPQAATSSWNDASAVESSPVRSTERPSYDNGNSTSNRDNGYDNGHNNDRNDRTDHNGNSSYGRSGYSNGDSGDGQRGGYDRQERGGYGGQERGGYGAQERPGYGQDRNEPEGPPSRLRESDSLQIESSTQAARSNEYTEERDEELAKKVFGLPEGVSQSQGINFSKYDKVTSKISGQKPPNAIKTFEELNLHPHVMNNIKACRYTVPTPVQKTGMPAVLAGRDLMTCAQTGSGKTASFLVPIIHMAMQQGLNRNNRPPRGQAFTPFCLIIAPTRELAIQIFNEARKFAFQTGIRPCVIYGGQPGALQYQDMTDGCDMIVGTPGRLQDFYERGILSFKQLKWLVLDEADKMLDMGFEMQLRKLMEGPDFAPKEDRQTVLWSATFPRPIQELAATFLKTDYLFLAIGRVGGACDNVEQEVRLVDDYKKRSELLDILQETGRKRVLIFVGSKNSADRLDDFLFDKGFPSTSIHGDRTQQQRECALESFRRGKTPIIVATDVASRGLDIPDVHHVILFDMPKNIDDYVHRIGRTGRAGHTGKATAFFTMNDTSMASDLVKILKEAEQPVPDFLAQYASGGYGVGYGGDQASQDAYDGRDARHSRW